MYEVKYPQSTLFIHGYIAQAFFFLKHTQTHTHIKLDYRVKYRVGLGQVYQHLTQKAEKNTVCVLNSVIAILCLCVLHSCGFLKLNRAAVKTGGNHFLMQRSHLPLCIKD